jgi:hypothetical protein
LLEHRQWIGDQEVMRSLRKTSLVNLWSTVLITIAAWVLLSNHCALGVLALPAETAVETGGCPMHSAPVPKKKPASKIPCCKEVRAIVATKSVTATQAMEPVALSDYTPRDVAPPTRGALEVESLDTGPPNSLSFAELVLQESMHAHAPPVS